MNSDSDVSDLPLATHTHVLGADIAVAQRDCHRHEYSGHRTRETAVRIDPFTGKITQQSQRRYIAAWARRTIERPTMEVA